MQEVKPAQDFQKARRDNLTRRWNLPSRNLNFTGREILLEQIAVRLSSSKPLVISALHGLGGVGKTQLVTEYAYRNENKYERVVWISAESTDQIETAYLSLGQDLKIIPEKTSPSEAILIVKNWLSNHPRNLIIFDNAPDYQTVENYVLSSGADVLIASRHTEWPEKGIEVDVFSLQESILYFKKIVREREFDTSEKIEELVTELGRLPLALAQAAAYIRENKISIRDYLDLYLEKKAYLLSKDVLPQGDHHATVYVTWDITMEKIKERSPLASALLNICSYLDSEKIPALLLETFCTSTENNPKKEFFEEARECLASYSMVRIDDQDNSLSVHRLVQEVTYSELHEEAQKSYLNVILDICDRIFPYNEYQKQLEDLRIKGLLLPHLEKLLPKTVEEEKLLKLLVILQDAYGFRGQPYKQLEPLKRILAIQEFFYTSEHIELVTTLNNLGNVYFRLGKMHESLDLLTRALKIFESSCAERESLKWAMIVVNLGNVVGMLGNAERQCELLEKGLRVYESCTEPDQFKVSEILNNLSVAYGLRENRQKELELMLRSVSLKLRLYGSEHPEIARAKVSLGRLYTRHGNLGECCRLLEEAIPLLEAYYGKEHVDLGRALLILGKARGGLKQPREELTLLQSAYTIFKNHYGVNHPLVADVLLDLARVVFSLNQVERAFKLSTHAHYIFLHHPEAGLKHPRTQAARQAVRIIASEVIVQLEKQLIQNPNHIGIRLRLAGLYLEHAHLEKSIFHYQAAIEFLEGDEAAIACHNLACLYNVKGNVESADQFFQVALVYRAAASTYADYGLFLYKQGRFQDAIENLLKIFTLVEDKTGLSYGKLELVRLDDFLQKEIQQHGDLSVKPILMAYYWIIRCYQQLGLQEEYENYLQRFRGSVEVSSDAVSWRLLSYTYEYLGKKDELEECRQMLSAIEFSKQMTDAEAVGQFGLHPARTSSPSSQKVEVKERDLTCKK